MSYADYYHRVLKYNPRYKAAVKARGKQWRSKPENKLKMRKNSRRWREEHRIRALALNAIQRAKKNGLPYDESYLRSLESLRPDNCPCCGIRLNYRYVGGRVKPDAPSLDRIDTLKGYIAGNIDIICWRCNAIKRDATLKELEQIVAYMKKVRR